MAWTLDGLAPNCAMAAPPSSPRANKIVRLLCSRLLKFVVSIIFLLVSDLRGREKPQCAFAQCYTTGVIGSPKDNENRPGPEQAAEKLLFGVESIPQPNSLQSIYVRPEGCTLQETSVFSQAV